jgi:non-specific serine/threonine protein kinase
VTAPHYVSLGRSSSSRHNIPFEATRLIGRDRDVAEIVRLLGGTRVLTLTGTGGIGKTRLALRVAAESPAHRPDGAWLVSLAQVTDEAEVPRAVASVLGLRDAGRQSHLADLVTALGGRRLLLVLDNCEHVIEACAELVEKLIKAGPGLRMLCTSREALRVPGEVVWRVRPLALPADLPGHVERTSAVESVALFLDRAVARRPDFSLTAGTLDAVTTICRRLGGLPLALELAAGQLGAIGVEQMAERLDHVLPLLTGGDRMLPRQSTLRATLDWSHALLTESERLLFRRLVVFAGSFTVDAAERVCSGNGLDVADVLPVLARLVEKSLVETRDNGLEMRYLLLEPVRQYGHEQLAASGESAELEHRRAHYYMTLAETLEPVVMSARRASAMERLASERDNLRAVLAWSLDAPGASAVTIGLRLAGALGFFWNFRGEVSEGLNWLDPLLERGADADPHVRARALFAAAELGWLAGDVRVARSRAEESAALWRSLGDKRRLAYTLQSLPMAIDNPRAHESVAESLRLFREAGDSWGAAMALAAPDLFALLADRALAAQGEARLQQALQCWRELGDAWGTAQVLNMLGDLARSRDDDVGAAALYKEALILLRGEGLDGTVPSLLHNLGYLSLRRGDVRSARRLFRESLALFRNQADRRGIADCITGLGCVLVSMRQPEQAARLFGLAETLRETTGSPIWPANVPDFERSLALLDLCGDRSVVAPAWTAGRALPLDGTLAELLAEGASSEQLAGNMPLTPRERDVAILVADGLTNREIGARLFITEGTARLHVKHILQKLGFASRAQIAAWAVEQGVAAAPPVR